MAIQVNRMGVAEMKYVEPEMSIINLEDVVTYMEIVSGGGNEDEIVVPTITG